MLGNQDPSSESELCEGATTTFRECLLGPLEKNKTKQKKQEKDWTERNTGADSQAFEALVSSLDS